MTNIVKDISRLFFLLNSQEVFVGNRGLRPNVNKFLIVISDGASADRGDLTNATSLAAREGIVRFAIGVSYQTHSKFLKK